MDRTLTNREKQYAKKFVQEAKRMKTELSGEWMAWAVFLLGGFLTVYVILLTQANLNETTIFYVLLPGTAAGLLLMFCGTFGMKIFRRAGEQKVLAEILTKLMK